MIAFTIEIGSELKELLTPLVVALTGLVLYRKQSKQFKPNGGSSLRDAVDRIEKKVDGVVKRVEDLESKAIPVRRQTDQLPPPPPKET